MKSWFRKTLVALFSTCMITGSALAADEHPLVPETLDGLVVADSALVLKLMESGAGTIIDARKPEDFKSGTIPGSINCQVSSGKPDLADAEVDATVEAFKGCAALAAADKTKEVAIFCNGKNCWRSPKGGLALKKMGFGTVLWYRLGANDWKEKGLPME